ncbi:MAG TPA: cytochrome c biogenesis protein CcdA [Roseiarcus sp.]|nr:cytochrome c biogenesis protein CcdA [Roseiarcus sp.]
MTDVTFPAAAAAGLISFLSPCVLPLAPPYLCYLAGASLEDLVEEGEAQARRNTVLAALLFVLGFATIFVALGATASAVGSLLRQWSHVLSILAGLGIIVMGLHFLGAFRLGALVREKRFEVAKPPGLWSAYLMGLAFAFGWTPCIGPILAAILAVAGSEDTVGHGAALLGAYSIGLGAPFVLAALAMGPFLAMAKRFRSQFGRLEKVVGALLVLTGVAFLSGGVQAASTWLIDAFPALGQLG